MLRFAPLVLVVLCLVGCGGTRTAGPVQVDGRLSAAQGERRTFTPAELDLLCGAYADRYAAALISACDATAEALAFFDFVVSPEGQCIIASTGCFPLGRLPKLANHHSDAVWKPWTDMENRRTGGRASQKTGNPCGIFTVSFSPVLRSSMSVLPFQTASQ